MKIAVLGKGNVGGGLADLWEAKGHDVQRVGREGGDVSGADVVLLAVPQAAIGDALASAGDLSSTPVIDATNVFGTPRPEGFDSLAAYVKSITGGPVAKSFSANFASAYDRVAGESTPPSNLWAGDDEAADVTETLIRDAGYEPVRVGDLDAARAIEDVLPMLFGVSKQVGSPIFYRVGAPGTR